MVATLLYAEAVAVLFFLGGLPWSGVGSHSNCLGVLFFVVWVRSIGLLCIARAGRQRLHIILLHFQSILVFLLLFLLLRLGFLHLRFQILEHALLLYEEVLELFLLVLAVFELDGLV